MWPYFVALLSAIFTVTNGSPLMSVHHGNSVVRRQHTISGHGGFNGLPGGLSPMTGSLPHGTKTSPVIPAPAPASIDRWRPFNFRMPPPPPLLGALGPAGNDLEDEMAGDNYFPLSRNGNYEVSKIFNEF